MLQQTRVATVIPYYEKFLRRFPTVESLARARTETLLRYWAGLGYYSRARNLQKAARQIVELHNGEFPRDRSAALELAGIGDYTAAAILSIAYDAPHAVLDGNVARVLARLGAVRGDVREPRRWQKLTAAADRLLARNHAGDWNQAMMELGATVCTPRAPQCNTCPISRFCKAYAQGLAERLPEKRRKRATVQIVIAAAVLLDPNASTLLIRPPQETGERGLFSRMLQFPAVEVTGGVADDALPALRQYLQTAFALESASIVWDLEALKAARHTVTHREITLLPFLVRVAKLPQIAGARILPLSDLDRVPISSATRKIAARAREHVASSRTLKSRAAGH